MSLTNLLKSTGETLSPTKNQYADIERMFQGYHNPYISQQSDVYDGTYYPGYMNNNGYGLKFGSSGPGGYGGDVSSYGSQSHHYPPPPPPPHPAPHPAPHVEMYPEVHSYGGGSSHHYSQPRHKSKGNSSAMSALTLLAFLFFLNILQSCLKEHMMAMNPTVMVMTAGSRKANQRTAQEQDDVELTDASLDYKIISTSDETESDREPEALKSNYDYHKFFNESEIKYQNANNYYRRKPHRS